MTIKTNNICRLTGFLLTACSISVLHAADPFVPQNQPIGWIAPLEANAKRVVDGTKIYRPWFENGAWMGDLIEYDVNSTTARLSSSIGFDGDTPSQSGTGGNWSAHVVFDGKGSSYWNNNRRVIFWNGTSQQPFIRDKLSEDQQAVLSQSQLDYVRGSQANEPPNGTNDMRTRFSLLGDIQHSNPVYIGPPSERYSDEGYSDFKNTHKNRKAQVAVGANDGMLHVFNATNGNEIFAYVPSMVIPNLHKLSAVPYAHTYFVDGGLVVRDAYLDSEWATVLVGGLGAGGKGIYALDLTYASQTDQNSSLGANDKILWEIDADGDADLGYTYGRPMISKMPDGKFYAVFGNGYMSVNGKPVLYFVNLATGKVTKRVSIDSGSSSSPNGLSTPALIDSDGDGMVDIGYAGDLDGNLWRFDLSSTDPNDWAVAYGSSTPKALLNLGANNAITTRPNVSHHPQGGYIVYVGTGRALTGSDLTDTKHQYIYAVRDKGTAPVSHDIVTQTMSAPITYGSGEDAEKVRTLTNRKVNWSNKTGWKLKLPAGYRILTDIEVQAEGIKFTMTNPASDKMRNWDGEVDYLTGGPSDDVLLDLNRDGNFNSADRVDGNNDGDKSDAEDIPMVIKRNDGARSGPLILKYSPKLDAVFHNRNGLPTPPETEAPPEECTGYCEGGFVGGHVDVDTDLSLGGSTSAHTHEYDDKKNLTYIDYLDINNTGTQAGPTCGAKKSAKKGDKDQKNITDSDLCGSDKFIVTLANADLSPGGVLQIGNHCWNVVDYQVMIHKKLKAWDGVSALTTEVDKNSCGNKASGTKETVSLEFTLNDIMSNKGTVRNTFDSMAIGMGGLHPTQTKCVKERWELTNGRYRNGALITHLIKRSAFSAGGNALSQFDSKQNPTDLPTTQEVFLQGVKTAITLKEGGDSYGGLVVKDSNDFIFESTLFWHFDDYADDVCYGDGVWAKKKGNAIKSITDSFIASTWEDMEDALEDIGIDTESLSKALAVTEEMCDAGNDKACELAKTIRFLLWLSGDGDVDDDGGGDSTSISSTGTNSDGGDLDDVEYDPLPDTNMGRRSWIDTAK